MQRSSWKMCIAAGAALAMLASVPRSAKALDSIEGETLGDQGFYWGFASEGWIFPHRIANIDNRAMLQLRQSGAPTVPQITDVLGDTVGAGSGTIWNALAVQGANGGGVSIELIDNLHLALWFSEFSPGLGGGTGGGFIGRAITATNWDYCPGGGCTEVNDYAAVDPYNASIDAGRKMDLFLAYLMPDSNLETGVHLWWGSTNNSLKPDDSSGPINIDDDSDPTTPPDSGEAVTDSKYSLSDFGLGLGAGYLLSDVMRVDAGLEFNLMSMSDSPNGVKDFVDAGGTGFAVNLRTHYDMSDMVKVGAFLRFAREGYSFKPLKQRDGGDLVAFWDRANAAAGAQGQDLNSPPAQFPDGDPASGSDDLLPVDGIQYNEGRQDLQLAGLVRFVPNSRATLYGSFGVDRLSASSKVSVGEDWFNERKARYFALPFIQLGLYGHVTGNLDLMMGVSKRWSGYSATNHAFDSRIPEDDNAQGGGTPVVGNEDNTNKNRRDQEIKEGHDATTTRLSIGARYHLGPVQFTAQMNPATLFAGPYFLFGTPVSGGPIFWLSLIYDWDFDSDKKSGNGTMMPHEPGKAGAPGEQVFES